MKPRVKLSAILDGLEFMAWSGLQKRYAYLDTRTGEVLCIPEEAIHEADEIDAGEPAAGWMSDLTEQARAILNDEGRKRRRYLGHSNAFDINEYRLMEKFALTQEKDHVRDDLYRAMKGKGAFRRFRNAARRHNVLDARYRRRDEALKEIAVERCRETEIKFVEGD